VPDEAALAALPEDERTGSEISSKQVFDRLAGCWTYWGWKGGYFSSEEDARAFYDELRFMLANQMVAPNSPQWFNTGLHWAYGIDGPSQGHFYVDHKTGKLTKSRSAYEHPQPHACFIQSVQDDLVNEGGIMDLWVREARLFKYGSGTGSNFSRLRGEGEKLSGGGRSSGLMSFLKIGDRAAGAIKSGGTTRRAAKMVVVDVDHPDIEILHRLEGEGGAEGGRPGGRLQARQQAPQGHHEGLRELRGRRRRLLRSGEEPGPEARDQDGPPGHDPGQLHQARHAVRAPGLHRHRVPDLRHRLGFGGLPHRVGPELQQLRLDHGRLSARGGNDGELEPRVPGTAR
jgi:ribonucleotide reductase alpha subunit